MACNIDLGLRSDLKNKAFVCIAFHQYSTVRETIRISVLR